jgi:hypothetical protein
MSLARAWLGRNARPTRRFMSIEGQMRMEFNLAFRGDRARCR